MHLLLTSMSLHSSSIIAIGVQYFGARAPNVTFVNHIYGQDCCTGCQDKSTANNSNRNYSLKSGILYEPQMGKDL